MQGDAHPSKLAVRDRRERVIAQLAESFARDELSVEEFEARIDAASLDHDQALAHPLIVLVDGSRQAQRTPRVVEIAVKVTNRDHAVGGRTRESRGQRWRCPFW